MLRPVAVPDAPSYGSFGSRAGGVATVATCVMLGFLAAGCSGLTGSGNHASAGAAADGIRLSITPAGGGIDTAPNRGITVRAVRGRISKVIVRTTGDRVSGRLNAARTVWRSTWALGVSRR